MRAAELKPAASTQNKDHLSKPKPDLQTNSSRGPPTYEQDDFASDASCEFQYYKRKWSHLIPILAADLCFFKI
uniref:Uncharacterized protein n=1 Tax=Steinernema glaseri TaxID=37863 RepID=A0A1I7YZJ2_9BILA